MEIIERSSGYWVVDESGVVSGPFIEEREAKISLAIEELADQKEESELLDSLCHEAADALASNANNSGAN